MAFLLGISGCGCVADITVSLHLCKKVVPAHKDLDLGVVAVFTSEGRKTV